jgi:hypothetical protein
MSTSIMKNVSTNASCKTKFCKVCKDAGKSNFTDHSVKEKNHLTGELVTVCPTLLSAECRYCFEKGHIAKYCPIIASKNKETTPLEYKNNKLSEKKYTTIKQINSNPISKMKVQSAFSALNNDSSDDENDTTTTTVFAVTQKKKQRVEQVDHHASSFQKTKTKTKTKKHVTFHTDESTPPIPNKTYETEFPSMSAPSKPVTTMRNLLSSPVIKQPTATNQNISFATITASKPKEDVNETIGVQEKFKDNWTVFDCLQLKTTTPTPTPKVEMSDTTKQKEVQKYLKRITKSWADASDDETEDEEENDE